MKGRNGVDLRYLRRYEIIALARHMGVADTCDLDRFLIAWWWHRPSRPWDAEGISRRTWERRRSQQGQKPAPSLTQ